MNPHAALEELTNCSICLERFTFPKALPCQHTYCLNCLRALARDQKMITCPHCREIHHVPKAGVIGFKDNLVVKNLLELNFGAGEGGPASSAAAAAAKCFDCTKLGVLSKCEHCSEQVCVDCRVTHNRLLWEVKSSMDSVSDLLKGQHTKKDHWLAKKRRLDQEMERQKLAFDNLRQVISERERMMDKVVSTYDLAQSLLIGKQKLSKTVFEDKLKTGKKTDHLNAMKAQIDDLKTVITTMHDDDTGTLRFFDDSDLDSLESDLKAYGTLRYGKKLLDTDQNIPIVIRFEELFLHCPAYDDVNRNRPEPENVPFGGAGPQNNATPGNNAGPRNDAGHQNNAGPQDNAAPGNNAGPRNNAGHQNNAGPQNNAAPGNNAGSRNNAGPRNSAGPQSNASPRHNAENVGQGEPVSQGHLFPLPEKVDYNAKVAASTTNRNVIVIGPFCTIPNQDPLKVTSPNCAVYNPFDERIYVSSSETNRICSFDKLGHNARIAFLAKGPTSMTVASDGNLYIAEADGRIRKGDCSGFFSFNLDEQAENVSVDLITYYNNRLLAMDSRKRLLHILNMDGQVLKTVNIQGANLITSMTVDNHGRIFLSNEDKGQCSVLIYSSYYGTFIRRFDASTNVLGDISSLIVDGDGNICITRPIVDKVDIYTAEGVYRESFGGAWRQELNTPTGLGWMPDGTILICDSENNRIQLI